MVERGLAALSPEVWKPWSMESETGFTGGLISGEPYNSLWWLFFLFSLVVQFQAIIFVFSSRFPRGFLRFVELLGRAELSENQG